MISLFIVSLSLMSLEHKTELELLKPQIIRETGKGDSLKLVLRNISNQPVKLWAPNNVEGMACISFEFTPPGGKTILVRPPVPPRAGGVATAIILQTNKEVELGQYYLALLEKHGKLPRGAYKVVAVYTNTLSERKPVQGAWLGSIRSKPVSIKL